MSAGARGVAGGRPGRRSLVALACVSAGCVGSLQAVARPPWVEDRSLALVAEHLRIDVAEREVEVDARFAFRSVGDARDRVMTFPIASPGGRASAFRATLERTGRPPRVLRTWRASEGVLPTGDADDTYEIDVPALATTRGVWLRVRYRQSRRCRVAYVLRTGAYWRGPIGRLDVEVVDPERRVVRAFVERRLPTQRDGRTFRWRFVNVEPHDGVLLHTCPRSPSPR